MTNTENDLFSSGFVLPEHRGGDGWTILHGDALDIIPHFQPGAFDAVITDPPLSLIHILVEAIGKRLAAIDAELCGG